MIYHVFLDQSIHQFTLRLRSQDVYWQENFLDGDKFADSSSDQEVRGRVGRTGDECQDRDPGLP